MHRPQAVLAQQLDELRQTAFLIRTEVIVNVPAQVIAAKFSRELGTMLNAVFERLQAE